MVFPMWKVIIFHEKNRGPVGKGVEGGPRGHPAGRQCVLGSDDKDMPKIRGAYLYIIIYIYILARVKYSGSISIFTIVPPQIGVLMMVQVGDPLNPIRVYIPQWAYTVVRPKTSMQRWCLCVVSAMTGLR